MNFCKECLNLLYPKEKRATRSLYYACRNCGHEELATTYCVYTNELKAATSSHLNINGEITLDPTLPRTKEIKCERCSGEEAVFFTPSDENMELLFVCCYPQCSHWWKQKGK